MFHFFTWPLQFYSHFVEHYLAHAQEEHRRKEARPQLALAGIKEENTEIPGRVIEKLQHTVSPGARVVLTHSPILVELSSLPPFQALLRHSIVGFDRNFLKLERRCAKLAGQSSRAWREAHESSLSKAASSQSGLYCGIANWSYSTPEQQQALARCVLEQLGAAGTSSPHQPQLG